MKLSNELINKIKLFSQKITSFSEKLDEVKSSVDKLNVDNVDKNSVKDLVVQAGNIQTEAKSISNEGKDIESDVCKECEECDELKSFSRKMRIVSRSFSNVSERLGEVTSEAKTVSELDFPPSEDAHMTEGETIQSAAESTSDIANFSTNEYINFTISGIVKSFAEIKDDVDNSGDLVKEVTDQVVIEPAISNEEVKEEVKNEVKKELMEEVKKDMEIETQKTVPDTVVVPPAQGNNQEVKVDDTATKSEEEVNMNVPDMPKDDTQTNPEIKTEVDEKSLENFTKTQDIFDFAIDSLRNFSEDNKDELISELDKKIEDSGLSDDDKEVLVKAIEDASTKMAEFAEIKNIACGAMDAVCENKEIDTDKLAEACEELNKKSPGAGDTVIAICEKFCKALAGVKGEEFCGTECKSFSEEIDEFIQVPLADKRMDIIAKSRCIDLQDAINEETPDLNKIGDKATEVAKAIKDLDDPEVKEFSAKLVQFAEELDATLAGEADVHPDSAAVAEDIAGGDKEMNDIIDNMDAKLDSSLKPEVATFAKKYLSSIKSIKCFSEEDLESKLDKVEEAKKALEEAGISFDSDLKDVNTKEDETKEIAKEPVVKAEPEVTKTENVEPEKVSNEVVCPKCGKTPCECTKTEEVKKDETKVEEVKKDETKVEDVNKDENEEVKKSNKLVDEPEINESELPSDTSVKNFSAQNAIKEFDPVSYLAGLNIR